MDRKRAWGEEIERGKKKEKVQGAADQKATPLCVFESREGRIRGDKGGGDCSDDGLPLQRQRHSSSLEQHGRICRLASTS